MDLRGGIISKFFAVWFVVMIVLPFTAPFQAWDPHSPVGKPPAHDFFSPDKLPKDAATLEPVIRVAPQSVGFILQVKSLTGQQQQRQALRTVLRV